MADETGEVPRALQNKPEVHPLVLPEWRAFWTLCRSRPVGMGGIGHIPYSEISRYAQDRGYSNDERDDLVYLIGCMDDTYIEIETERAEQESKRRDKRQQTVTRRR